MTDLTEETEEDGGRVAEMAAGTGEAVGEPAAAREAAVAELDVLEGMPEALTRVRAEASPGRRALEPLGSPSGEDIPDRLAVMGRAAVPDDQALPGDLGETRREDADAARTSNGMRRRQGVDVAAVGAGADERAGVAGARAPEHRRLAARRVGADEARAAGTSPPHPPR